MLIFLKRYLRSWWTMDAYPLYEENSHPFVKITGLSVLVALFITWILVMTLPIIMYFLRS